MRTKQIFLNNATVTHSIRHGEPSVAVYADALDALKSIGEAAGLYYSGYEKDRACRIMVREDSHKQRILVLEEDISLHGSCEWRYSKTLTDDQKRIDAYLAFHETLKTIHEYLIDSN